MRCTTVSIPRVFNLVKDSSKVSRDNSVDVLSRFFVHSLQAQLHPETGFLTVFAEQLQHVSANNPVWWRWPDPQHRENPKLHRTNGEDDPRLHRCWYGFGNRPDTCLSAICVREGESDPVWCWHNGRRRRQSRKYSRQSPWCHRDWTGKSASRDSLITRQPNSCLRWVRWYESECFRICFP